MRAIVAVGAALLGSAAAQEQFWNGIEGLPRSLAGARFVPGDIDGDGDLDVLCVPSDGPPFVLRNRNGAFEVSPPLPASVVSENGRLGDVDGDGDLDVLLTGTGAVGPQLFRNDGTAFVDVTSQLPTGLIDVHDIAVLDFEGDGDLDLWFAMGVFSPTQQRTALNDGTGRFTLRHPALNQGMAQVCWQAIPADIDNDGDMDVLTVSIDGFWTATNDGTGVFAMLVPPAFAFTSGRLAVGDLDGDGDVDAIQDGIRFNNGLGVFAPAQPFASGTGAPLIESLADLDGDGDLDLQSVSSGQLWPLRNNGNGAFTLGLTRLPATPWHPQQGVLAAHLDGDSFPDLLAPARPNLALWFGTGQGAFVNATATPAPLVTTDSLAFVAADLDGDGAVDLADRLHLLRNDGWGGFTEDPTFAWPVSGSRLEVADLDGDGRPEAVLQAGTTPDSLHLVRIATTPGTPWSATLAATVVAAAAGTASRLISPPFDFDGDGDAEVFWSAAGLQGPLRGDVFDVSPASQFVDISPATIGPTTPGSGSVAAGDLDGDGDVDLVLSDALVAGPRVLTNDGTGRLTQVASHNQTLVRRVEVADLDGDGNAEILRLQTSSTPQGMFLHVDRLAGGAYAAGAPVSPLLFAAGDVRVADVDGDGDLDVLLPACETGLGCAVYLFRNSGGTLTATRIVDSFDATFIARGPIRVADLDGDGDPDIVVRLPEVPVLWNLERHVHLWPQLRLGSVSTIRVDAHPGHLASPVFAAVVIGNAAPAPIVVPGIGRTPIDLASAWTALLPVPAPDGHAQFEIAVPNQPSLVGFSPWLQAAVLEADGVHLTNATRETVR